MKCREYVALEHFDGNAHLNSEQLLASTTMEMCDAKIMEATLVSTTVYAVYQTM